MQRVQLKDIEKKISLRFETRLALSYNFANVKKGFQSLTNDDDIKTSLRKSLAKLKSEGDGSSSLGKREEEKIKMVSIIEQALQEMTPQTK